MTHAAIRPDLDQALDAHLNFAAQITFDLVVLANELADRRTSASDRSLIRDVRIDLGLSQNFLRASRPNPKR